MKAYKLIFPFIFVINSAFSQEKKVNSIGTDSTSISKNSLIIKANYNKWIIDMGTGISNGTRPYSDGYFTTVNNRILKNLKFNCFTIGGRYNFSPKVGLKIDVAFDQFINNTESKSKPFEVAQYRTSFQGIFNLNGLVESRNDISRFNLLLHAGVNLSLLRPVESDYNNKVSRVENFGGLVFGIMPTLKVAKKTSVFLDFSTFNNYGQNLNWNGKHNLAKGNDSVGNMYAFTFGLSFALDKKQL